jgi:Cu-processing system permease protein
MKPIGVMFKLTLREAARRKVLWGLLILSVLFLVLYALGLSFIQAEIARFGTRAASSRNGFDIKTGYSFLATFALYAANFLIVLLAVLIPMDTLAGEIGSGTIQSLAVKPLRRSQIVLGKWLGFVLLLGACTLLLVGGTWMLTLMITGYALPNIALGWGAMLLEALVFLSISFLGGTRLSTLANGVLGFGLFIVAFVGGFIGAFGTLIGSNSAIKIGDIVSLVMPGEMVWRAALSEMAEGINPLRYMLLGQGTPDASILIYAVIYAAVILLLAIVSFQRRDL